MYLTYYNLSNKILWKERCAWHVKWTWRMVQVLWRHFPDCATNMKVFIRQISDWRNMQVLKSISFLADFFLAGWHQECDSPIRECTNLHLITIRAPNIVLVYTFILNSSYKIYSGVFTDPPLYLSFYSCENSHHPSNLPLFQKQQIISNNSFCSNIITPSLAFILHTAKELLSPHPTNDNESFQGVFNIDP